MHDLRLALDRNSVSLRWMTRLLSVVISGLYLLITWLAVTNEDKPQGAAIPVLALLVLTYWGLFRCVAMGESRRYCRHHRCALPEYCGLFGVAHFWA